MRRAALAVATLCWVSCAPTARAPATLESVTPSQGSDDSAVTLLIQGKNLRASVRTNFTDHQHSAVNAGFVAELRAGAGTVTLTNVTLGSDGALRATVPALSPRGTYDLRVVTPLGEEAVLQSGYRVVSAAGNVSSFRFDPIGAQRARIPFLIALAAVDAQGNVVDGFTGSVALSDKTGTVSPAVAGPFALGRWIGQLSIGQQASADAVSASDALNHVSTSATFDVHPGLAVALSFTAVPTAIPAGNCSTALALAPVDSSGQDGELSTTTAVLWATDSAATVSFYSDAACTTPVNSISLSPAQPSGSVFVRTSRAGPLTVRAIPDALPSTSATLNVAPGPAVALGFPEAAWAAHPQVCSGPVVVEVDDAAGNPSPRSSVSTVALSAQPPAGFTFFADATCSQSVGSIPVAPNNPQATFYFLASNPGDVAITASDSSDGLTSTSQVESISP